MSKLRVLIVDDHTAVRRSLAQVLRGQPGIEVAAEAPDGAAAVRLAKRLQPDVVLMDVVMPVLDGIEATRQIVLNQPRVRVVGLSVHDSPVYIARMLEAGASAYLLKDCDLETLIRVMQCPDRALAGVNDKAVGPASAQSAKWAAVYQFR